MSNETIQIIKTRRSVRSYKSDPVPQEVVEDIIDCARLAATGRGVQPWEFIAVTDRSTREKIAEKAENGKFIAEAPVCVAVFCADTKYYLEDGSAATQNILLGAWAHGVGSCWVAGDKKEYAADIAQLLGVPDGYRLISLVSLGYPAHAPGEKQKRPLNEVLHWQKW